MPSAPCSLDTHFVTAASLQGGERALGTVPRGPEDLHGDAEQLLLPLGRHSKAANLAGDQPPNCNCDRQYQPASIAGHVRALGEGPTASLNGVFAVLMAVLSDLLS